MQSPAPPPPSNLSRHQRAPSRWRALAFICATTKQAVGKASSYKGLRSSDGQVQRENPQGEHVEGVNLRREHAKHLI